ncbi:hypothetical protein H5410_056437 [Solanum commersonii]|uniref:Uncharacterized protein n=1 Tax=Solanum commersonii TaxID=4109 RepID=A0A9J5WM55_SOLCO|nr:hypothetical protein H5410_056437 [Solanum commersonii]
MDYSTQKLAKRGVYHSGAPLTLTMGRKCGSPNGPWTIAHENRQNSWFISFKAHFTLKIGQFSSQDQPTE